MRLLVLFLLTIISMPIYGQQEPHFAFTQFNLSLINPAYVGSQGKGVFALSRRSQWSSIDGSPESYAFTYATERNNNVGIGVSVISDKTFIEQQTFAYIDFSYKLQFSDNTRLFLGLKGGGSFYNADLTSLENFNNLNDPSKVAMSKLKPNVGIGAFLAIKNTWISLSAPRLFEVSRADEEDIYAKDRVHLYAAAGTSIALNNSISIKPSVLLRKVKGLELATEATALVSYRNRYDAGVQIRDNSSMGIFGMFSITNSIALGYAYESFLDNSLSGINVTTHEVFIRIQLATKATGDLKVESESSKQKSTSKAENN